MMIFVTILCIALSISAVHSDTCQGRCSDPFDNSVSCQCNDACTTNNDCCSDYDLYCNNQETCVGRDCTQYISSLPCQCNDECENYGNCCPDRYAVCSADTCSGRCGQSVDSTKSCQCNEQCASYGDCCPDYVTQCNSGGGNCDAISVSDNELETISYEMWNLDSNSFPSYAVQYDTQGSTTTSATDDAAPYPFFTYVDSSRFAGDTYQKLIALQDNYIRTQGYTEVVPDEELEENSAFLDAVLSTSVGQSLYQFLDSKNLAGCAGMNGFKDILNDIWFGMYDRQATRDTSGFEHSFVGEIKGSGVSGFHNWVYFYHQELADTFNYQGYISKQEPRMVGMRHTWYGAGKKMNGFTIGTSPEIELALYTLCHLSRPNSECPIMLSDSYGNTLYRDIQTYSWTSQSAPNGQSYIASAFFLS